MDYEQVLAAASKYFQDVRPLIPMNIHLILAALAPIYTGAHASLSRPSSAAKLARESRTAGDGGGEDEEEEDKVQQMEGMSLSDAIMLPLAAGIVLAGLYFLIMRYGAELINLILSWYFAGVGVFSVAKLFQDAFDIASSFVFPTYFAQGRMLYKADAEKRKAVIQGNGQDKVSSRDSPIPFVPTFTKAMHDWVWRIREAMKQQYTTKAYIPTLIDLNARVTLNTFAAITTGLTTVAYANLIAKPWWLTNLQGFAVCYSAMQFMSPTTFATGSLILTGLFFYDIWAVFFTPLMVTVAKNLDQPIKMVFPRPDISGAEHPEPRFSILGLGDIVLPGLMIGIALRFDLYMFYLRKQRRVPLSDVDAIDKTSDNRVEKAPYIPVTGYIGDRFWTALLPTSSRPARLNAPSFTKPYFHASIVGYVAGMLTTLAVMTIWNHAQPALLYLVPAVLISLWGTGLMRGELREMWSFSEALNAEQVDEEAAKKVKQEGGVEEGERNAEDEKSWWQWLQNNVIGVEEFKKDKIKAAEAAKEGESKDTPEDHASSKNSDVLISFSITRYDPKAKQVANTTSAPAASSELPPTMSQPTEGKDLSEESSDVSLQDTVIVGKKHKN